jgi:hypothetical protein
MAALPMDISVLLEQAIRTETHNPMPGTYITCQGGNNLQFNIGINMFHKYVSDPKYTGKEIIKYRGLKIATWFNKNTGCFEGEILFMNHQLDILAKQEQSLFENVYYKYFLQNNDMTTKTLNNLMYNNTKGNTKEKTFKLRCYVREFLIHSVDTILNIMQNMPVDDIQFKFIASHFQ